MPEALDKPFHFAASSGIGHRVLERMKLVRGLGHLACAGHGLLQDGASAHLADVLAEVADDDALLDGHLPAVGLLLVDDHPKDGRFARTVRADQADLLASEDAHRGVEK